MAACKVCGRHFATDRVEKHESICKKTSTKKRKVFDPTKMRMQGTEAEPYLRRVSAGATKAPAVKKDVRAFLYFIITNVVTCLHNYTLAYNLRLFLCVTNYYYYCQKTCVLSIRWRPCFVSRNLRISACYSFNLYCPSSPTALINYCFANLLMMITCVLWQTYRHSRMTRVTGLNIYGRRLLPHKHERI